MLGDQYIVVLQIYEVLMFAVLPKTLHNCQQYLKFTASHFL